MKRQVSGCYTMVLISLSHQSDLTEVLFLNIVYKVDRSLTTCKRIKPRAALLSCMWIRNQNNNNTVNLALDIMTYDIAHGLFVTTGMAIDGGVVGTDSPVRMSPPSSVHNGGRQLSYFEACRWGWKR